MTSNEKLLARLEKERDEALELAMKGGIAEVAYLRHAMDRVGLVEQIIKALE
ncbi:hypothetical protein [Brevundimonas sp.]|uniref:hypothetical protein n=1 Tax=Brevundimonas sp. TaxID=1871086 RepID=UPI00289D0772|nr:hypothetical protein [Brevundimonas sp.]